MAPEVFFRPAAEADLIALYEYIADQAGEAIAAGYIDRIEAACKALATFPKRGVPRDDVIKGLRTIAFERRVVIAYQSLKTGTEIIAIVYGGRDFESLLLERK